MKSIALSLACLFLATAMNAHAQEQDQDRAFKIGPRYTKDGKVIRPEGWRKWVYVGTPVTPDDMNGGEATFREFHNSYIDPDSFATFHATGKFPNGTMIAKEMVLVGSKEAASGNGYFMGEFFGLELAIKDTVRFRDEPGGWVYTSFGHKLEPYDETGEIEDAASCNSCHEASADTDWVFTQYYPVLRAAMPKHVSAIGEKDRADKKGLDKPAMDAAIAAAGSATKGDAKTDDDYANKMFTWLQSKEYRDWPAEAANHRSRSFFAHGNVRTYYNDKMDESFAAGNKTHPIGAMAVKELFDKKDDSKHIGWALTVKARDDDGKGHGWYWYEVMSLTDGSKPIAASLGNSKCVGCHKPGVDFNLTKALKR